jgi:CRP-like cAMP-binding protein
LQELRLLADQPTSSSTPAARNRLLAALPPDDLARLQPRLEAVELPQRQVLHAPGQPIEAVYFPETGWISMLAYLESGDAAEVGLVGREGMAGLPVLLGADSSDLEAMVQCPGSALRMDAQAFREELDRIPALRTLLLRYALVHQEQVARTAACNGRHQINERLARWLLMAHDRAEGDDFPMTHEFLSMMLGVRRAGVTVAAGTLQKAGFIRYDKGRMEVTDRPGLESVSCECYGIVRRASDRLFGTAEGWRSTYRP